MATFCYSSRYVTEIFYYGDVLYGDILSMRRFVRRLFFMCAGDELICGPGT
jgi:hypothetical protein